MDSEEIITCLVSRLTDEELLALAITSKSTRALVEKALWLKNPYVKPKTMRDYLLLRAWSGPYAEQFLPTVKTVFEKFCECESEEKFLTTVITLPHSFFMEVINRIAYYSHKLREYIQTEEQAAKIAKVPLALCFVSSPLLLPYYERVVNLDLDIQYAFETKQLYTIDVPREWIETRLALVHDKYTCFELCIATDLFDLAVRYPPSEQAVWKARSIASCFWLLEHCPDVVKEEHFVEKLCSFPELAVEDCRRIPFDGPYSEFAFRFLLENQNFACLLYLGADDGFYIDDLNATELATYRLIFGEPSD